MRKLNNEMLPDPNCRGVGNRTNAVACLLGSRVSANGGFANKVRSLVALSLISLHFTVQACSQILEEHHRAFGHILQFGRTALPKTGPLSPANCDSVSERWLEVLAKPEIVDLLIMIHRW